MIGEESFTRSHERSPSIFCHVEFNELVIHRMMYTITRNEYLGATLAVNSAAVEAKRQM